MRAAAVGAFALACFGALATAVALLKDRALDEVLIAAATMLTALVLVWTAVSRRRSRAAQAESEQQFRLTVDNAPIGITLVRLDGQFLHPNTQLQQMVGYSAAELCAMTFADITHRDDLEADVVMLDQLVQGEISH